MEHIRLGIPHRGRGYYGSYCQDIKTRWRELSMYGSYPNPDLCREHGIYQGFDNKPYCKDCGLAKMCTVKDGLPKTKIVDPLDQLDAE